VIVSRLELARSYAAMEEWSLARELLKSIAKMPNKFSDDPKQKRKAEELLEKIDNR
jgi:FimV-like protein